MITTRRALAGAASFVLVAGLADDHLPRHTDQLLALLPEGPGLPAQNRTVANDPT